MYAIKNAQINRTLEIMWEMFIGEKRPMWCMQEGFLKWGTLVIMWRQFMKESLSIMAIIDKDSFMNCLHMITRVPHFRNPSCIHHIGRFSPMNISHMISKVLLICAFFIAYITVMYEITNNYNFKKIKIMFPIPSLSKPWEDIPFTQSFWTKFCPWLKLV